MYYRLDAQLSPAAGYMREEANDEETLMSGRLVDEKELTLPWPFKLRPSPSLELQLADYYPGKNLMSARLVNLLKSCGVDNLQTFPAEIVHGQTQETLGDFLVVNVLGLVSAANLADSKSVPLADVQYFEQLAIDPAKARGLLMFRLADSRVDLIIAERVASAVRDAGLVDVIVEPLK